MSSKRPLSPPSSSQQPSQKSRLAESPPLQARSDFNQDDSSGERKKPQDPFDLHLAEEVNYAKDEDFPLTFTLHHASTKANSPTVKQLSLRDARALIRTNSSLRQAVIDAQREGLFKSLLERPELAIPKPASSPPAQPYNDDDLLPTFNAFHDPYQGDHDDVLIDTMKYYLASKDTELSEFGLLEAYNNTLAVIQSSGMGKSRTVDAAAKKIVAFQYNLRDPTVTKAYPPSDVAVAKYLMPKEYEGDNELYKKYTVFLVSVFDEAAEIFSTKGFFDMDNPASKWYEYLQLNRTTHAVGPNKRQFDERVVSRAESLYSSIGDSSISQLQKLLRASCDGFLGLWRTRGSNELYFFAFDEAHGLTSLPKGDPSSPRIPPPGPPGSNPSPSAPFEHPTHHIVRTRSAYDILGSVLSWLVERPVFFLFLSTNSSLEAFAPSMREHPSLRAFARRVFPPYTELPFDVFAKGTYDWLKKDGQVPTLSRACEMNTIVRFGRPMWQAEYMHKNQRGGSIIRFVRNKLAPKFKEPDPDAEYAALAIRIMLSFDAERQSSRRRTSKLVESYLRIVLAVPEHREFMRTGNPSEPILAEAAARYLDPDVSGSLDTKGPEILARAFEKGFVARGERGEVVSRLLMTVAHDKALSKLPPPKSDEPKFHRPIKVMHFLEGLFAPAWLSMIREAKPVDPEPNSRTLEDVFENAWLNFSHFILAQDFEALDLPNAWKSLIRGYAIQARDNQQSVDGGMAIHFGDPESTPITQESSSLLREQTKNRRKIDEVFVSPTINLPNKGGNTPQLTIVFELGSSEKKVEIQCHESRITRGYIPGSRPDNYHYVIVAHGVGPETFAAVPPNTVANYTSILARTSATDDFPRKNLIANKRKFDAYHAGGDATNKIAFDWF